MRPITLILPYYLNPTMLQRQQETWAAYPADVRAHLHVIVVDDGSPQSPASDVFQAAPIASQRLYRTQVDVRWNWIFCRNLGVSQAATAWVLMTDIDHLVPTETLRRLMAGDLDEAVVYRFSRVDAPDLMPYKPHPNSWFMTREMFDRIGGYDERFSGYYGTDGEYRDRVESQARHVELLSEVLIRVPLDVVPDASTTTYGRKEPIDRYNVRRIRRERDQSPLWRPKRLTFPWERLA